MPLGGGGGASLTAFELLASTGTLYDPSAIGVSQAAAGGGKNVDVTIDTPATVSNLPHLGYGRHYAVRDVYNALQSRDAGDPCFPAIFGSTPPVATDLCIGVVLYNDSVTPGGAPQATSAGYGCKLVSTAGDWNVRCLRSAAGWLERAATNTNANTVGAMAEIETRASLSNGNVTAQPLDASFTRIAGTNEATLDDQANIGSGLNRIAFWAGWETGVGGPSSTTVQIHAALFLLKAVGIPGLLP